MPRKQQIRLSQMVFTYGPGAIIETRYGPRVVLREHGLPLQYHDFRKIEIVSLEARHVLASVTGHPPERIHIFRVPPQYTFPDIRVAWKTAPFPEWSLCLSHHILYRRRKGCPKCREKGWTGEKHYRAIRFVLACPDGHMDDVDWIRAVHYGAKSCRPDFILWNERGTSLDRIQLQCPRCKMSRSLGDIYRDEWPCSGRYPERDGSPAGSVHSCSRKAHVIQRQASNLRIPDVYTFFTMPPLRTRLHEVLLRYVQTSEVPSKSLDMLRKKARDREMLEMILEAAVLHGALQEGEKIFILQHSLSVIQQALDEVQKYMSGDMKAHLRREFHGFLKGLREGIPPVSERSIVPQAGKFRSQILIEMHYDPKLRQECGPFIAAPVQRLRTVTVQAGYRRSIGELNTAVYDVTGRFVDVGIPRQDNSGNVHYWYPGFDGFGEGLFITLNSENQTLWNIWFTGVEGKNSLHWESAWRLERFQSLSRYGVEGHPAFVAWHTLSHYLIRALAEEAGYSLPSIRERVYVELHPADRRRMRGGILIYTATRGGDGALGGFQTLLPHLCKVFEKVRSAVQTCSGDPLCIEQEFSPGDVKGAVCHACGLISETSCEHRNLWLDRHVLLEWFQSLGWLR